MATKNDASFVIVPAILTDSRELAQAQLNIISEEPSISLVQFDVIDGNFADRLTLSPSDMGELSFGVAEVDVHLITDEPMDFVYELVEYRDQLPVRSVIAQIEHMSSISAYLDEVKRQQWKVGVSLDIYTPLEELEDLDWQQLDIVQLAGNTVGRQGMPMHPNLVPKLTELHELARARSYRGEVLVDIGVRRNNIDRLRVAGATGVVVGSEIWSAPDPLARLRELAGLQRTSS